MIASFELGQNAQTMLVNCLPMKYNPHSATSGMHRMIISTWKGFLCQLRCCVNSMASSDVFGPRSANLKNVITITSSPSCGSGGVRLRYLTWIVHAWALWPLLHHSALFRRPGGEGGRG